MNSPASMFTLSLADSAEKKFVSEPSSHFGFVVQVDLAKSTLEIFFLAVYHILLDN
jgi:hypothetical protein